MSSANANHTTNPPIETGQTYGRLTAIRPVGRKGHNLYWLFRCKCGTETEATASNVASKKTLSCGCLRRETKSNLRHGMSHTPTHNTWRSMIQRCSDPGKDNYKHYGARGIVVCDRWQVFENFLADMGGRPEGTTIDRIDNDGDYEPGNCRWATQTTQVRNQSGTSMVLYCGEQIPLAEAAEKVGLSYALVHTRIHRLGWSVDRALNTKSRRRIPPP